MAQQGKIRLLIADDHEVVRSGLKGMLAGTEIQIVAAVASGQEALKYALENQVDVVLLDVRMSDGDGLNALGRIKLDKPDLPILMFSYSDNPTYVARAVALGASGYLLKGCTRDELLSAIKAAAAGESTFTRDGLGRHAERKRVKLSATNQIRATGTPSARRRTVSRNAARGPSAGTSSNVVYKSIRCRPNASARSTSASKRGLSDPWLLR